MQTTHFTATVRPDSQYVTVYDREADRPVATLQRRRVIAPAGEPNWRLFDTAGIEIGSGFDRSYAALRDLERIRRELAEQPQTAPSLTAQIKAAADAGNWDLHAELWEARRVAAVDADEAQLTSTDTLKSEGRYRQAGAFAFARREPRSYGCHFGMRSDRDAAIREFNAGFDAAEADRAAEIAGMASEPDNGDRFY